MDNLFESKDQSTLDKNFKPKTKVPYKVLELNRANYRYLEDKFPSNTKEAKERKEYELTVKSGEIIIDSRLNRLIGYVYIKNDKSNKPGVIGPLWIDPEYRGQGFGELLFKDAINKYGGYQLGVYKDNEVAIKMYKKYGFKVIEEKISDRGDNEKIYIMTLNGRPIQEAAKVKANKLYHVSQSNLDNKTIRPTIPNNYFTKNGFEDGETPRVCFATSIDKCLRALSQKCTGMELYVHTPDDISKYEVLKPSSSEVPDSSITSERWICTPVKMKCIGKIKVLSDREEDGISFKYGDNTAELYDWDWEWIDESYVEEACKNRKAARKFVADVQKIAKKYDANYFIVTDGASGTYNPNGENDAVKHARDSHKEWERQHGFDPEEDWSKQESSMSDSDFGFYERKGSTIREFMDKLKASYNFELINEDMDEINPEVVAEGDYIMRCLREGKDPFETIIINSEIMESRQIRESAGDPVPMVGMDQPVIVLKMFKNVYNQPDQKIYIANNHKFDRIFEADGIDDIIECNIATTTLTLEDLMSEDTRVVDIPMNLYEEFLNHINTDEKFSDVLKEVFLKDEVLTEDARDIKMIHDPVKTIYWHIIKWNYEPSKRSTKWGNTISTELDKLNDAYSKKDPRKIYDRLNNNKSELQLIYDDALKDARTEIKKHGGKFDIEPPKEIPDEFLDLDLFRDRERLAEYMRTDPDKYYFTNKAIDEKILKEI